MLFERPGKLDWLFFFPLEWMREKNYSPAKVRNRDVYFRYFLEWCDERSLVRPSEITKPSLTARFFVPYYCDLTSEHNKAHHLRIKVHNGFAAVLQRNI